MLRKLFKYDFEASARIFLILYGVIALLTILGKTLFTLVPSGLENAPLLSVLVPTYIILIIGLIFGFNIFLIVRFYRSLFTDEGYLYHTLPVKPWQLILSKLFTNVLLSLCGLIIIALCVLLLLAGEPLSDIMQHRAEIGEAIYMFLGFTPLGFCLYLVFFLPVSTAQSQLTYFASIALGQVLIPKHKVLGAFTSYVIYYVIIQALTSIPLFAYSFSLVGNLITDDSSIGTANSLNWVADFYQFSRFYSLLLSVILGVVFFLVTNYIMKKKLNLD